jgi:dienelactone hydrolase
MPKFFARRAAAWLLFLLMVASVGMCAERDVDLTAPDGTKLKASYFSAGKTGPGVLLLHQCNRDRKGWDTLAQQLAASGLNVLTLDNRGFGESGGVPHDKASPQEQQAEEAKWPGDIDVAFQYLVSQPGVIRDTIGAGGASCGVDNAVQTAMRHPEVRSLVLLSGETDYKGRQFLRTENKAPVFFAYADDDEFPETPLGVEWLYSVTSNPEKKLVVYKTGGHGAEIFPVHPELMGLITDWYVTTLIKTPGEGPAVTETVKLPQQALVLNTLDEPGGAAKVEAQLQEARKHDPHATLFREDMVNLIGYEHLQAGDIKGAIEILKLNAMAYPNSPNVYDSLGDAYLADGQKELARQSAKKTLELLPSDTVDTQQRRDAIKVSAEQKLKQPEVSAQ